jgi:nucleotide-binding universal stress UspA family protein
LLTAIIPAAGFKDEFYRANQLSSFIMKKISAAFDGLKFSDGTMRYAIKMAAESKALLSGVFLDDILYHSYSIPDLARKREASSDNLRKLDQKDKNLRLQSAACFEANCDVAHVRHLVHHDKTFAIDELIKESIYSDLLVIAADETLSRFTEGQPANFVTEVLADIKCPALVVPRKYKEIEKVILLFDGKPSSVFAIKMFSCMMPWMRNLETELIVVTDPEGGGKFPDEMLIKEFISCHYHDVTYTLLQGDPVHEIENYLRHVSQNILIVLGAYGRGAVSRLFKVSMADHLIRELGEPVFIAHNR